MHDKSNIYPELKILSPLEQTWASYRRNPLAMAGLWCFGLLLLVTLIGPLVIPYGIDDQHSNRLLLAPSWASTGNIDYFLGTDDLGRDILSRLVAGARLTFGNALLVVVIALVVGSEGHGLSARWEHESLVRATIPMNPDIDSLNVAASVAIAAWELRPTRLAP